MQSEKIVISKEQKFERKKLILEERCLKDRLTPVTPERNWMISLKKIKVTKNRIFDCGSTPWNLFHPHLDPSPNHLKIFINITNMLLLIFGHLCKNNIFTTSCFFGSVVFLLFQDTPVKIRCSLGLIGIQETGDDSSSDPKLSNHFQVNIFNA